MGWLRILDHEICLQGFTCSAKDVHGTVQVYADSRGVLRIELRPKTQDDCLSTVWFKRMCPVWNRQNFYHSSDVTANANSNSDANLEWDLMSSHCPCHKWFKKKEKLPDSSINLKLTTRFMLELDGMMLGLGIRTETYCTFLLWIRYKVGPWLIPTSDQSLLIFFTTLLQVSFVLKLTVRLRLVRKLCSSSMIHLSVWHFRHSST